MHSKSQDGAAGVPYLASYFSHHVFMFNYSSSSEGHGTISFGPSFTFLVSSRSQAFQQSEQKDPFLVKTVNPTVS